jgi:hypothetical protein
MLKRRASGRGAASNSSVKHAAIEPTGSALVDLPTKALLHFLASLEPVELVRMTLCCKRFWHDSGGSEERCLVEETAKHILQTKFEMNGRGQRGSSTTLLHKLWVRWSVASGTAAGGRQVSAGNAHTVTITRKGVVHACGHGGQGQLGSGDHNDRTVLTKSSVLSKVRVRSSTQPNYNLPTFSLGTSLLPRCVSHKCPRGACSR